MRTFLETGRLVLRPFTDADAAHVYALHNDPDVMRFINGGRPTSRATLLERTMPALLRDRPWLGRRSYWAAEEKQGGAFVGWFEFRPLDDSDATAVELGYRLTRASWGRGYATEGSRALIGKGFGQLGVDRVTATTMAVNTRSRRVMEKCGLSCLRHFTEDWPDPIEGSEHGEVEYELLRADREAGR
ncbi:GNAT family N-acetyltransferase [Streptomyces sp. CC210A]|uniref:GNAT family N-acetyltransferase n=1 Tax=Streptomyces sp. CC210A TaxID=2898184 RepID=UPI001F21F137|nr:GNAT family N-acetyltransferase [Streptomyces sp. CC210A]